MFPVAALVVGLVAGTLVDQDVLGNRKATAEAEQCRKALAQEVSAKEQALAASEARRKELAQVRATAKESATQVERLSAERAACLTNTAELEAGLGRANAEVERLASSETAYVKQLAQEAKSAAAAEKAKLEAKALLSSCQEVLASEVAQAEAVRNPLLPGTWPECLRNGVSLHAEAGSAALEDLAAILGPAVTGCLRGDCTRSDTFVAPLPEECAHMCAASANCSFWTHGLLDGSWRCWLRTAEEGRAAAANMSSAIKGCAPPPTQWSQAAAVLAVLNSDAVKDAEDEEDAVRTWLFAYGQLQQVVGGFEHNYQEYLDAIEADMTSFLKSTPRTRQPDTYGIVVANNREVFGAFAKLLQDMGVPPSSLLDASVPRPVRGLLCAGTC